MISIIIIAALLFKSSCHESVEAGDAQRTAGSDRHENQKSHLVKREETEEGEIQEGGEASFEEHEEEDEEEETHSTADLVGACALLGGITFVFNVIHILNHPDKEVRKHSWTVISRTISIFTSVLLFQGVAGLIELVFLESIEPLQSIGEDAKAGIKIMFFYLLFFLSYCWLHITMWYYAFKRKDDGDGESHMAAYSILNAHFCGFVLMRCMGVLQQLSVFRGSPLLALLPVLANALLMMVCFRLADMIRSRPPFWFPGGANERYELWDSTAEEAENDVAMLSISFSCMVVLRYIIAGTLPNEFGFILPVQDHSVYAILALVLAGMLCFMIEFAIVFSTARFANRLFSMVPTTEPDRTMHSVHSEISKGTLLNYESTTGLDPICVYMKRWVHVAVSVFALIFAWCFMYALKWTVSGWIQMLGYDSSPNSCVQQIVQSLVISFIAFGLICTLDILIDLSCTGGLCDFALEEIIKSVGILIGFTWEQSFDSGVEEISELTTRKYGHHAPAYTNLALAIFIGWVMIPGWRKRILMKVMESKAGDAGEEAGSETDKLREELEKVRAEKDDLKEKLICAEGKNNT